ncbi:MAG: hypothetical protein QOF89_408 [Acidobacteriota bacterium]|jgi:hypothetical protein|nr:hypothetical protein [Acidobacteriota bacterium]
MSKSESQALRKVVCCFAGAIALAALVPQRASAQGTTACGDAARANFAQAVASGASDQELEAQFGACRDVFVEPACTPTATKSASPMTTDVKTVTNFNTSYERMNGCGYHPQAEMVACDVEIRQLGGYGAFPGGTFENVRFCLDCNRDGIWDFTTLGFVHVTDNVAPGPVPSWYHLAYATTFAAPALCTNNDGRQTNVRAILSWAQQPGDCNSKPFWGNMIDFTARRDP